MHTIINLPRHAIREVATNLERWFDSNGRKFPWRNETDPYKVLVVEFLLQRTKAETINRIYKKFFENYPSLKCLASSDLNDLYNFFSKIGLTYRSKRLKNLALKILEEFEGNIPSDMDALLRIRGVGVYIASAVLNFGFKKPVPVVDKNVLRVMNRLANITQEQHARDFIKELFRHGNPQKISYALIDLGSLVCRENPVCDKCPLNSLCSKFPLKKNKWKMLRKIVNKNGKGRLVEQPVY